LAFNLTTQDKKILKMRGQGESLEDIADHFNISLADVKSVFPKIAEQVMTADNTVELMKIMNETPYDQTRKSQRRILDGIDKKWLVEYAVELFPTETQEALQEKYQ